VIVPSWAKGILLLAVTLAAGVALGAGYERRRSPSHDVAEMHSDHMLRRFTRELALDSAQQKAVAAILERRQRAVDSTWRAVQPHVHAALDSTVQEIGAVLRPDQMARLLSMVTTRHPGSLR
jgi:hypothetical protein